MAIVAPFNRRVDMTIGPLREDSPGATAQALAIQSTGDRDSLRVQFHVEKSKLFFPNPAKISIFNLSERTRRRLVPYFTRVLLSIGWENTDLFLLYSGAMLSSASRREGPNIVTTMSVLDGMSYMSSGQVSKSYSQGTAVAGVVRELASLMGVSIGTVDVSGTIRGVKGRAIQQRPSVELNLLASEYGFTYTVENGVFEAFDDTKSKSTVFNISRSQNLIHASPILATPFQTEVGVEVEAILDPRVAPLSKINLDTSLNVASGLNNDDGLNGVYVIHNVSYIGDTHGQDWNMSIKSFPPLRAGARAIGS